MAIKHHLDPLNEGKGNDKPNSETQSFLPHKETYWKQYLAAFLASLVSLSTGCVGGWSSPATPVLLNKTYSDMGIRPLTLEEVSWVGALINLGAFFGSIPAGYLSFKFGRKSCLLTLAWPIIIGWLFILFNNNSVWYLYIGRFISGISYGSLNVALPMYTNEISGDRIRGRNGIIYDLMQCVGLLWVYAFGAMTTLFWTTVLCLVQPVLFLLLFMWMPESPLYLVRTGKMTEAIKSIKWLRGENCNIDHELTKIGLALLEGRKEGYAYDEEYDEDETLSFSLVKSFKNFYRILSPVTIKTVLIAFFMFVLQRTCGATMVQYYADSIFELSYSSISPGIATVLIGIISIVGSILSVLAVDTIGRRFLLIFSFLIMTLSMAVFVGYLIFAFDVNFLPEIMAHRDLYGLIPSVSLCLFVAMFRLGVSPVPWFMAPEIIPTEAQQWAPSTIVCITWGTSFLLSKSFLPAIQTFGQVPVYSFFLLVCAIGVLYTWVLIPETKNKSREEIQRALGAPQTTYKAI